MPVYFYLDYAKQNNSVLIVVQKAVGVVFMLRLGAMQYSSFP